MTQPVHQMGLRQRLQGLAATLLILLLVAGVPFLLIAIGAAPWKADLGELRTTLTSPDDGTLAMVVIGAVAWIAWAFVAVSVVLEVVSQVRGLPTPTLPGLGAPQRAVGQLVAVAALLFVAAPTVVAAFPTPPAHAAAAAPLREASRLAAFEASPVLPEAAPVLAAEVRTKHQSTIDYTVKRGDSLWKIAERLLGDGTRFTEIVDLNRHVLNGRPDFIVSGTVLKVPHEVTEPHADRPAEEYVVQPGDTLSEIAEAKLGDPMRYPELFEASRDTVQPDGATLTDPNLIRPGWEITIPGQVKHKAEAPTQPPHDVTPPGSVEPPGQTSTETPSTPHRKSPPPPPATATADPKSAPSTTEPTDEDVESSTPGWLVPGLTGPGPRSPRWSCSRYAPTATPNSATAGPARPSPLLPRNCGRSRRPRSSPARH